MDSSDEIGSIIESTKITSLNTDCMEFVFEHLNVIDLVNVADSNTQFYSAVCQVFKQNI